MELGWSIDVFFFFFLRKVATRGSLDREEAEFSFNVKNKLTIVAWLLSVESIKWQNTNPPNNCEFG